MAIGTCGWNTTGGGGPVIVAVGYTWVSYAAIFQFHAWMVDEPTFKSIMENRLPEKNGGYLYAEAGEGSVHFFLVQQLFVRGLDFGDVSFSVRRTFNDDGNLPSTDEELGDEELR